MQITKVGSKRWAELDKIEETERQEMYPSLETMPELYQELNQYQHQLEQHFRNMRVTHGIFTHSRNCGSCKPAMVNVPEQLW
ncbi:MAG: hypothetical protein R2773_06315 [Flavobacteriaceae bacterium]